MRFLGSRATASISAAPDEGRFTGIDAARGIALIGMMAVHVLPRATDAGTATWSFAVFGGRAAALFAVLAGVSVAFQTRRKRVTGAGFPSAAAGLAARAAVIAVIGLALEDVDPELAIVILPYYAVLFVVAIPLMALPTSVTAWIGAVIVAGAPIATRLLLPVLPDPEGENPGFSDLMTRPSQLFTELTVTGAYPALTWIGYVCAGLVIGRLTLTRARIGVALTVAGLTAVVGAYVTSAILLDHFPNLDYIWSAEPHTGTTVDLTATIGSAIAVIGVMLLLAQVHRAPLRRLVAIVQVPLAAAGRMTLTLYTLHVVFINSDIDLDSPTISYLLQIVAAVVIGLIWRVLGRRGPLEAVTAVAVRHARRLTERLTAKPTAQSVSAVGAPPMPSSERVPEQAP